MATNVSPLAEAMPVIRIFIESDGNLNLGNVGRFFQRLDTGARRAAEAHSWRRAKIEIAELSSGSIDLKIKLAGLRLAQASLAVSIVGTAVAIADYLKSDPAATRATRILLVEDRATNIRVEGGGEVRTITADDLLKELDTGVYSEKDQVVGRPAPPSEPTKYIRGLQEGFVKRIDGEFWVELGSHPGLIIRVRDERQDRSIELQPNARYTLDGVAVIAPPGHESYFVLREAILLT